MSDPVAVDPGLELAVLVPKFLRQLVNHSASDTLALMNEHNLTMAQVVTLRALNVYGPHAVFDISDRLKLSRAATSHLVDRLVQDGLVQREESSEDRRQKHVSLSHAGRSLIEELDRVKSESTIRGLSKLSPEVQRAVAEVMVMIIDDVKQLESKRLQGTMRTERCK